MATAESAHAADPLAEARVRYSEDLPRLRLTGILGGLELKTPGDATALCLTPDGRAVTVGQALHVFDLATGRELARARQPWLGEDPRPDPFPDMDRAALLPDGRLVTAGPELLAWDLSGAPRPTRLRGLALDSIAVAAGAPVLVGARGSTLHLIRLEGDVRDLELRLGGRHPVRALAISPDGRRAWAALGRAVIELDARDGLVAKRRLPRVEAVPTALVLSPDGELLVAGHEDGSAVAWRVGEGPPAWLNRVDVCGRPLGSAAFAPEGDRVVLCEWDALLRTNPAKGEPALTHTAWVLEVGPRGLGPSAPRALGGHGWMVSDARIAPGGRVVTLAMDKALRLFDAASGQPRLLPAGHAHWPVVLALSPDEQTLVSGGMDGSIRVWDVATRAERQVLPRSRAHQAFLNGLAWSAEGTHLASCSVHGELGWWELDQEGRLVERGRLPSTRQGPGPETTGVAVLGSAVLVSTCDSGIGGVSRWEPGKRLTPLPLGAIKGVTRVARWDEHQIALGTWRGELALLDLAAPGKPQVAWRMELSNPVLDTDPSQVYQLATDPSGGRIAGSLGVGHSGVVEVAGDRRVPVLTSAQARWVRGLVIQQGKGQLAASSSEDGSVRVWDTTDGRPVAVLQFPVEYGECPAALALTSGGRLYVGTYTGAILEYQIQAP